MARPRGKAAGLTTGQVVEVCKVLSVREAARSLGVHNSAVTYHLRKYYGALPCCPHCGLRMTHITLRNIERATRGREH